MTAFNAVRFRVKPGRDKEFLDAHNDDPKPFQWSKTADEILASIARFGQRTLQLHGTTT